MYKNSHKGYNIRNTILSIILYSAVKPFCQEMLFPSNAKGSTAF